MIRVANRSIPPRVVHLSTVHRVHDVRITVKEAASLASAGFDVTVVACEGEEVSGLPERLRLRPLPTPRGRLQRVAGVRAAAHLALEECPALVHLHDPELLAVAPMLRRAGARVVYDMHEDLSLQMLSKRWLPRGSRAPLARLVKAIEPLVVGRCDGLVVVDEAWLERFPHMPHALLRNLPLAAETKTPKATTVPIHRRAPRLLYAGGIDEGRGASLMVRAFDEIATTSSLAAEATLELCGPIAPPALAATLRQLDRHERCRMHGWLDRPRLLDLLDDARAGLLMLAPQPNYEHAVATKLFEYLRAGLPVIASDTTAHRTLIGRFDCGLLVPHGDVGALADAMARLLVDDALVERLSAGARRAWDECETFECELPALLALYARLGVEPARGDIRAAARSANASSGRDP